MSANNLHDVIYFCHHTLRLIDRDIDGLIGELKAEREELDNLIKELGGQCTQ